MHESSGLSRGFKNLDHKVFGHNSSKEFFFIIFEKTSKNLLPSQETAIYMKRNRNQTFTTRNTYFIN